MKYVITGVNVLSGERENISLPMDKDNAETIVSKCRRSVYKKIKIEEYPNKPEELEFTDR